jgi:hypothetical protein
MEGEGRRRREEGGDSPMYYFTCSPSAAPAPAPTPATPAALPLAAAPVCEGAP